ncbi:MAG: hypothetical protein ACRC3B_10295 [Bacteroidia bacterium]
MAINNQIGMSLSMFKTFNSKALITLKSKKIEPFVARVHDLDVSQEDTQIIFTRCEETVFPEDTENSKKDHYTISIDKIKEVKLFAIK